MASEPLSNPRYERFAQDLAAGIDINKAFEAAGFKPNKGNARALRAREEVAYRIKALLSAREARHEKSIQIAVERTGISMGRVLEELAKIGFSDIRKAVSWQGNEVTLTDSDQLDESTAGAISEVRKGKDGQVSIKLHDKRAALVDIGRHLGMFKDKLELSGSIDLTKMTDEQLKALDGIFETLPLSGGSAGGDQDRDGSPIIDILPGEERDSPEEL
jgi:phage terminase small subunit